MTDLSRKGIAFLSDEVQTGFRPNNWSETRVRWAKSQREKALPTCLSVHLENEIVLSLALLDHAFASKKDQAAIKYAMNEAYMSLKDAVRCAPLRHYTFLKYLHIQTALNITKARLKGLYNHTRYLSPYQMDNIISRIQLIGQIPTLTITEKKDLITKDAAIIERYGSKSEQKLLDNFDLK
ncbi:MAG: hypothetical protein OIF58_16195 [Cohaesibacter sp.]|nr:hypothetical protein [Cohaesibacter sp.]